MGDHRADIKISLRFPDDKKREWEAWINYSDYSSECSGVDQRIIDFFRDAWDEWLQEYNHRIAKYDEERNREATERTERELLARLKTKYGET